MVKAASKGLREPLLTDMGDDEIFVSKDSIHILKHHGSYMQQNRMLKEGEAEVVPVHAPPQGAVRRDAARRVQRARRPVEQVRPGRPARDHAPGLPAPRRAQGQPEDRDRRDRQRRLEHVRRLRRHQPQHHGAGRRVREQQGVRLRQPVLARDRRTADDRSLQRDLARRAAAAPRTPLQANDRHRHRRSPLPCVAASARSTARPQADGEERRADRRVLAARHWEFKLDEVRAHDNGNGIITGHPIEPLYGRTYLPKKFKIAFTVPGDNSVDLYINDIGCVVIMEPDGKTLKGTTSSSAAAWGAPTARRRPSRARPTTSASSHKDDFFEAMKAILAAQQRDHGNRARACALVGPRAAVALPSTRSASSAGSARLKYLVREGDDGELDRGVLRQEDRAVADAAAVEVPRLDGVARAGRRQADARRSTSSRARRRLPRDTRTRGLRSSRASASSSTATTSA